MGVSSVSVYEWIYSDSKINFTLLTKKKALIAELADTIIPRTSTPGAKDAKVENYILKVLEFCTNTKEQHIFFDGINDLERYTLKTYNADFINCSTANRIEIIKHFEDKAIYSMPILNKINNKLLGKPFFAKLKELTIQGYCTSELGATKGMVYDDVPSTFQACIHVTDNQLAWATK